jgi:hypothetical protein
MSLSLQNLFFENSRKRPIYRQNWRPRMDSNHHSTA